MYIHDYNRYPELTNTELQVLGFTSPHHQYTEDFFATVVKVHDGDTVTLRTADRDFNFPLRLLSINAPELNEEGGHESQEYLSNMILDKRVSIILDKNQRVGKYGRLLGKVISGGMDMGEIMKINGKATPFDARKEGKIESFDKIMMESAI